MPSVGSHLRELRQARGVSLKEMARSTRVRESYLEALEADTLDELPGPVFARGFIRAFCQVLNASPDDALRLYSEQAGVPQPAASRRETPPASQRESRGREPVLVSLILLVVLGVALFAVTFALQGRSKPVPSPAGDRVPRAEAPAAPVPAAPAAPPPAAGVSRPAPVPVMAPVPTPPAESAPVTDGVYRLVARATEPTWIRVKTDDGVVTEETMSPGQVREWVSNRRFVLTVGNAGGLALELNGRALPPLGPSGAVLPQLVIPNPTQ